jgi:hypothetical protein
MRDVSDFHDPLYNYIRELLEQIPHDNPWQLLTAVQRAAGLETKPDPFLEKCRKKILASLSSPEDDIVQSFVVHNPRRPMLSTSPGPCDDPPGVVTGNGRSHGRGRNIST